MGIATDEAAEIRTAIRIESDGDSGERRLLTVDYREEVQ
jgi:hypothetical protein